MTGPGSQWFAPTCGRRTDPSDLSAVEKGPGSVPAGSHTFLGNLGHHHAALESKPLPSGQGHPFRSDLGIGIFLKGDFGSEKCILCGRSCCPKCDVCAVCLAGVTSKSVVQMTSDCQGPPLC